MDAQTAAVRQVAERPCAFGFVDGSAGVVATVLQAEQPGRSRGRVVGLNRRLDLFRRQDAVDFGLHRARQESADAGDPVVLVVDDVRVRLQQHFAAAGQFVPEQGGEIALGAGRDE